MSDTNGSQQRPTPRDATAAVSDDPAVGLRAVRSLRTLAERLEALQVGRARALGWSWQDIADALGVSRQAVHKKHGSRRGTGLENGRD
ncbi:helix-turn-helix domain-containing protein [Luteimicrobium sp. NPDC057192]|uniref:helix-turn-helix domain-containing protein n=1 Tax=Luteimicrobium sp. NPDC057192 TaxID=3346042 RepID=UPI003627B1B3